MNRIKIATATVLPAAIAVFATFATAQPAVAQGESIEQFYTGKQIRFIIRSKPGGGYDQYSRLLGRHIGKHIPGKPTVVPINMPGGGGIIAANHVANIAPRDGTILTIVSQGLPVDQALGLNKTLKADMRDFLWVGNLSASNQLLVAWHTSATKNLEDAKKRETTIGATGAGSISTQMPTLLNNALGTRLKVIYGYPDGTDVNLAMEKGELEGRSTNPWASYRSVTPHYVERKLITPLIQIGMRKAPELPHVPLLLDQPVSAENRPAIEFMSKAVTVGRPIATTPGAPADRVAAMRRAFDAALKDPEFITDAQRMRAEIEPMSGEELQSLVNDIVSAPPQVIERVKLLITAKGGDLVRTKTPVGKGNAGE
ncbi:MAG: hypothetical protein FJX29_02335 [Alphaproteobacteria bacterium]|nr:hypothetical protein [Alphaproteobacteria bacterium]